MIKNKTKFGEAWGNLSDIQQGLVLEKANELWNSNTMTREMLYSLTWVLFDMSFDGDMYSKLRKSRERRRKR